MELHVRAVSARNLLDKQTFGKQDPYCKLSLRGKTYKTRVHDNGGRVPVWNERFTFQVFDPQLDQLVIQVKDKNFTASVLIGECRLPVNMFLSGSVVDQWYPLNNGSHRAGEINLRVQFLGAGANATAPVTPAVSQPRQTYVQQPVAVAAAVAAPSATAYPPPPQQYYPPPQPYPDPYAHHHHHWQPQQYPYPPPPPPPQVVGAPPIILAPAGPPTMVYTSGPSYGPPGYYPSHHRHHHGGHHGRGGGVSTGEAALGVGAGVLGGMLLGEALFD